LKFDIEEPVPVNKKQLQRLVKFVAMLKENRYPNCASFVDELQKEDLYGNRNIPLYPEDNPARHQYAQRRFQGAHSVRHRKGKAII